MDEKTRVEILNDPVYGPDSPFFWPGTVSQAEDFVLYDLPANCKSTKDFLEKYKYNYARAEYDIKNTEDLDEEYINKMYAHFHKVFDKIESWPSHTFFVSAFYRIVFHQIFPYQSLHLRTILITIALTYNLNYHCTYVQS